MNIIEDELRLIWTKYEPQRAAERDALRTRQEADAELRALNERRHAVGLQMVVEYQPTPQTGFVSAWPPPQPKTWRDELDAELLSAVKRWLQ